MTQVVLGISALSGKCQAENSFFYHSVKHLFLFSWGFQFLRFFCLLVGCFFVFWVFLICILGFLQLFAGN